MKKLTKLSFKHYLYFFLIMLFLAGATTGILFLKIESSFQVHLVVASYKPIFIIANNDIYKIKRKQKITIKINNRYYYTQVDQIEYDNDNKIYKAKMHDLPVQLVPGSVLEARIIYDSKKLYEKILE